MAVVLTKGSRGELVTKLQKAVGAFADGDFGTKTETAVKTKQAELGLPQTGEATQELWSKLFDEPCSLFERCLNLTACFEGHGYSLASGNWDNAGLTWGIIGFTVKSGSLFDVLERTPQSVLDDCLGPHLAYEAQLVRKKSQAERVSWGAKFSDPTNKRKLAPAYAMLWKKLGEHPDCQQAQRSVAFDSYWYPATSLMKAKLPTLASERAFALAFDRHVQQGRLLEAALQKAKTALPGGERAALSALAEGQAVGQYASDIRARAMTIATGSGAVHGISYDLTAMGVHTSRAE